MLEGTLDSFTLPDVFQLLAFTKKTGRLELEDGTTQGDVYFKDGQVYYAVSDGGRLALGRRLVGAGLVGTDDLAKALEDQRAAADEGRGLRLGQLLVEAGVVAEETLETMVREQIQDAVFDLMRWTSGSFSFEMGEGTVLDEPIELAASVENLIMEGSRRLEEWEAVHRKIPSRDAVVAMSPLPGDSTAEVSLQPQEWRLLTLVDGTRTVGDLVDIFGQGEFHTSKVLYGLVEAGLVEVRDPEVEGPPTIVALLEQHELLRSLEGNASTPRAIRSTTGGRSEAVSPAGDDTAVDTEPTPAPAAPAATVTDEDGEADVTAKDEDPTAGEDRGPRAGRPAPANSLKAKVSEPDDGGERSAKKDRPKPEQRLTTDPSIDEDLVRRLIDGVKGL